MCATGVDGLELYDYTKSKSNDKLLLSENNSVQNLMENIFQSI